VNGAFFFSLFAQGELSNDNLGAVFGYNILVLGNLDIVKFMVNGL